MDLCSYAGHDYLIMVDCYTDWPAIISMPHNTTTPQITAALRQAFCRTAIPDILWSDGGPQFTSAKFNQFAQQWGFFHKTSSPYHPQSNGKIKSTVKSMNKIIYTSWNGRFLDDDKFCRALLQYRNTPSRKDGVSPAQKLFGYPTQDTLPAHRRSFSQEWQRKAEETEQQAETIRRSAATYYNAHAQPLTEIEIGTNVAIQNPAPYCGISMASSQPFPSHQTEDITSKPPVAECWLETVDSYAEVSLFIYHYRQVPQR